MLLPAAIFLAALGTAYAQPKHNYDLLDVNWTISFDEKQATIVGGVTNTLSPTEDGITQVAFHEGKLDIKSITVDEAKAHWTVNNEDLIVDLPKPANRNQILKIRILYSGHPQAGVYFVDKRRAYPSKTGMVFTQGEAEDNRYWLPTYDKPDDKATAEAHIIVPKGYFAISNGALVEVLHRGDTDVFHWKLKEPVSTYLISFVAGPYDRGHETWDTLSVDYYVPPGLDDWGEAGFGGTAEKVKFYSELTGVHYAYEKFAQDAVGDFPFGGMENVSAVTQTIRALFPPKEYPLQDSSGLVLHELAHQWFGDLVTCQDWSHNWLNEGFATFLPHFWYRKHEGEDYYQWSRAQEIYGAWFGMEGHRRAMVDNHYNVPMDNFDGNAYGGGAARMFVLQSLLGEDVFWRCINEYLKEYRFKTATTDQFFEVMSRVSGRNLDTFRKQWFYTPALPHLTVTKSGSSLTVTQTEPTFDLDLDVWSLDGTRWHIQKLPLNGKSATLDLGDNANKPVLIDPLVKYIAKVDYAKPFTADELYAMYTHAPNAAVKSRIILIAQELPNSGQLAWSLFKWEQSKSWREEFAQALAPDHPDELLDLTKDQDPKIALAAVQRLGQATSSPAIVQRLQELWTGASSDTMRNAALNSLLALTKDATLADTAWNTDSFDDSFRESALRYFQTQDPDKARKMALEGIGDNHTEYLREASIGVLGALKDKAGDKIVFNTLVTLLNDPGHGVKRRTLGALRSYGDPAAIPYLQKLTDYSMYQIREPAKAAIAELSKK